MKNRMATIWQPGRGIQVQDLGDGLILFRLFHEKDVRWIADRGPWSFDGMLLILKELQPGELPSKEGMVFADFWIQVSNLCAGFSTLTAAKALGNFIGTFISYDERATSLTGGQILRIRARLDIREPLKKEKKIKKPRGDWILAKFRYEQLPNFCFICGRIGHIDRHCEIYFRLPDDKIIRNWDITLKAAPLMSSTLG
ncbi:hypothetical protein LINPERHAP1_LOCUS31277 [Linum perenne]